MPVPIFIISGAPLLLKLRPIKKPRYCEAFLFNLQLDYICIPVSLHRWNQQRITDEV